MLDLIIQGLQKLKERNSGSSTNSVNSYFLLNLIGLVGPLLFLYIELESDSGGALLGWHLLFAGLYLGLLVWFNLLVYKSTNKLNFVYSVLFPVIIGIILLQDLLFGSGSLVVNGSLGLFTGDNWGYYVIYTLGMVYPVWNLLSHDSSQEENGVKKGFSYITFSLLIWFALSTFFRYFVIDTRGWTETINNYQLSLLVAVVVGFLFAIPSLMASSFAKSAVFERKKIYWSLVGVFVALFLLGSTGKWYESFLQSRIDKAYSIIQDGGENKETYQKAMVAYLKKAYLHQFEKYGTRGDQTFVKLFDSTPEGLFGNKLENVQDRRSFATNLTKVGKNADVSLRLFEIKNEIKNTAGVSMMETTYRIHVENKTETNQEFVVNFQAPDQRSVITDLLLGLNGELQGVVASRGAARQVYEDSLRKNIDPALIEKVGTNTYSLRVFPVLSKFDDKSKGKQLVELKMLTPLNSAKETIYAPRFSFINLDIEDKGSLVAKTYVEGTLVKEDIVKDKKISDYLGNSHQLEEGNVSGTGVLCINNDILSGTTINKSLFSMTGGLDKVPNKVALFLDNSLSVKRNDVSRYYDSIYDKLKNPTNGIGDIDVYSYNFMTEKVADLKDIEYWGYSDIDGLVDFVVKNKIENQHIIIVTDDDGFNISTHENNARDLSVLVSNKIDVIKIGQRVKTMKSDFTSLVAASHGGFYTISTVDVISGTLETIRSTLSSNISVCDNLDQKMGYDQEKLVAGYVSDWLMGLVKNSDDREKVAMMQNQLAVKYQIVNQFNSMIALETEQQKEDLERYEEGDDKYEVGYANMGETAGGNEMATEKRAVMPQTMNMNMESTFDRSSTLGIDVRGASTMSITSSGYSGSLNASIFTIILVAGVYIFQLYYLISMLYTVFWGNKPSQDVKNETMSQS